MNYVGAREGVPVPKVPYARAGRAEWVVCDCGLKHRPGAFHIHVDLGTPEPELPLKPKPKRPSPKRRRRSATPNLCACGKRLDPRSRKCRACLNGEYGRPACGTIAGYNWHRRQALKDPTQSWPLPKDDACGCRAAQAENSRLRRLQEKGEAA